MLPEQRRKATKKRGVILARSSAGDFILLTDSFISRLQDDSIGSSKLMRVTGPGMIDKRESRPFRHVLNELSLS